jgi:ribonuclease P protein component
MTVVPLPSRSDFDAVFENPDAKFSHQDFLVLARKIVANGDSCRIGFVTSKKKIKRAVDRNRFRRVFRETLRTSESRLGVDYVVVARRLPGALHTSLFASDLKQCFEKLARTLEKKHAES